MNIDNKYARRCCWCLRIQFTIKFIVYEIYHLDDCYDGINKDILKIEYIKNGEYIFLDQNMSVVKTIMQHFIHHTRAK